MKLKCEKCKKEWQQKIDFDHLVKEDGEVLILCDNANCPGKVYRKERNDVQN